MLTALVQLPRGCTACGAPVRQGWTVLLPEVRLPDMGLQGDPCRLVAWCPHHVPAWLTDRTCPDCAQRVGVDGRCGCLAAYGV